MCVGVCGGRAQESSDSDSGIPNGDEPISVATMRAHAVDWFPDLVDEVDVMAAVDLEAQRGHDYHDVKICSCCRFCNWSRVRCDVHCASVEISVVFSCIWAYFLLRITVVGCGCGLCS